MLFSKVLLCLHKKDSKRKDVDLNTQCCLSRLHPIQNPNNKYQNPKTPHLMYANQGNAPKRPPIDQPSWVQYCKQPNTYLSTVQIQTLGILMKFRILSHVIILSTSPLKFLLCKCYSKQRGSCITIFIQK